MKYHISPTTGNPGVCKAQKFCPFGRADAHYDSKEEARAAYERAMEGPQPTPGSETEVTAKGNTFSTPVNLADNALLQTVNGKSVRVEREENSFTHRVVHDGQRVGIISFHRVMKTWAVAYGDGTAGPVQQTPVDAMALLLERHNS